MSQAMPPARQPGAVERRAAGARRPAFHGTRSGHGRTMSTQRDALHFAVDVPSRVVAGRSVPVVLRLTNRTSTPVVLHLLGRTIAFDIVVRAGDAVLWRRLEGAAIPAVLQLRPLGPGETLELRDVWDQRTNAGAPVGPGRYTVQGVLPTDEPEPLETQPVPLEVEAV